MHLLNKYFCVFIGLMKDWTDSFVVCQIVLIVMNALFIVPWAMEIVINNRKAKSVK